MANTAVQALTDMRSNFPDNFFSTVPNGKIKYQKGIIFQDFSSSVTARGPAMDDNTPGEVSTNVGFSKFISVINPTYDTAEGGKIMLCYTPDAINYQSDNKGDITDVRVNRRFFFPGVAYLKVSGDGKSLTSGGLPTKPTGQGPQPRPGGGSTGGGANGYPG